MNPLGLIVAAIGALLVFVGAKGAGILSQRKAASSSPTAGAGAYGPQGQVIGTPGTTGNLSPGQPYTPGLPSYPTPGYTGTGPVPSALPGAGTTGGEGLG